MNASVRRNSLGYAGAESKNQPPAAPALILPDSSCLLGTHWGTTNWPAAHANWRIHTADISHANSIIPPSPRHAKHLRPTVSRMQTPLTKRLRGPATCAGSPFDVETESAELAGFKSTRAVDDLANSAAPKGRPETTALEFGHRQRAARSAQSIQFNLGEAYRRSNTDTLETCRMAISGSTRADGSRDSMPPLTFLCRSACASG